MPGRFDLLVFDWDGTLMDSAAVIVASLQAACADEGLRVPSDDGARYVIGLGLADALSQLLPELDERHYPQLVERYRQHFLLRDRETRLFSGAADIVRELHARGFSLAIATGKSRRGLDRALAETGLGGYFHATRCADEGEGKPHPAMLLHLMSTLGIAGDRTLMIGDTSHDMEMARAAGVARLGVAYGAHPKERLAACDPVACVDDVPALHAWLREHA